MTLRDHVRLWELKNPNTEYLDGIDICSYPIVDKQVLWNYLLLEYMDMSVVINDTYLFREEVKNFFQIHRWNIDELAKTLEYEYDPLTNNKWTKVRGVDEEKNTDYEEDTINDHNYNESGRHYIQDVNYVSAFNEDESPQQIGTDADGNPIYKFNDTEHDRQTQSKTYSLNGNTDDTTNKVSGETMTDTIGENITYTGNDGVPYQEYIEKQRSAVQFNIYKWISRHFCKELLVAIW